MKISPKDRAAKVGRKPEPGRISASTKARISGHINVLWEERHPEGEAAKERASPPGR
jgi:hypothetical protein